MQKDGPLDLISFACGMILMLALIIVAFGGY